MDNALFNYVGFKVLATERGRYSCPERVKNFHFSVLSGPTHDLIQPSSLRLEETVSQE
jgi:hypothetical protein